ncbi:MAG TPA: aminoglycoside 3'-phosphotransferase [Vicinamibacterales bacterium]|nr:aminoglycoside 3'-phosphotransferase [Vicinamibacterales bacterium]
MTRPTRSPIVIGMSGATVFRVTRDDGAQWIEKSGLAADIAVEAAVMKWCAALLPVPDVLAVEAGVLTMSALPGVDLTEAAIDLAVALTARALDLIHSVPTQDCPFRADWATRLHQAEQRVRCGLVDASSFEEANLGRTADDILAELQALPDLPPMSSRFVHGDACLPNFLTHDGALTGIVDLGRAGVGHPAQDWALALRSMRNNFGSEAERALRKHVPQHCQDEALLGRFLLLDELF